MSISSDFLLRELSVLSRYLAVYVISFLIYVICY